MENICFRLTEPESRPMKLMRALVGIFPRKLGRSDGGLRSRFSEEVGGPVDGANNWHGWYGLDDYIVLERKGQVSVQPSHE